MIDGVDSKIQIAAIRVAGNVSTGSDEQTQHILDAGVLSRMPKILSCRKSKVHKVRRLRYGFRSAQIA